MKLANIKIRNFRGIRECDLNLPEQAVLVGDNNSGKSTILEAIELVLGPERLSRRPVIDEHDFYAGQYLDNEGNPIEITVEVVISELSPEQRMIFAGNLLFWDKDRLALLECPPPESTDSETVVPALRVGFRGCYDADEDDFMGETTFLPIQTEEKPPVFRSKDKRICGFLYLRTLRTGSRALSLERGSLLDIILKLKEVRPHMWEDVLSQLRDVTIANDSSDPKQGLSEILTSVQDEIRQLVPAECADAPTIRVSQLTREHLRQVLTAFLATGADNYAAPFHHQGTGTVNILVLALLSIIAKMKQRVIFAMEEPEISVPPHTQKRVINSVLENSAQAIFTSHSPYVLEEFDPKRIVVISRRDGVLYGVPAALPPAVKQKAYRDEVKRRFCEALLARRVLIVEGRTEYDAYPFVARKMQAINPESYTSLEGLGVAVINAGTDTQIAPLGNYFRGLGKEVYAVFDKQDDAMSATIRGAVDYPFESTEKGFEDVILKETSEAALRRYAAFLIEQGDWPRDVAVPSPETVDIKTLRENLRKVLRREKGDGAVIDIMNLCEPKEIPQSILGTLRGIRCAIVDPVPAPAAFDEVAADNAGE